MGAAGGITLKQLNPSSNPLNFAPEMIFGGVTTAPNIDYSVRRIASVIWNPYTPKSAHFESGLLGPVVLAPAIMPAENG